MTLQESLLLPGVVVKDTCVACRIKQLLMKLVEIYDLTVLRSPSAKKWTP